MTRTRYRIFETEYPYFMTCTIVGWLPVLARPEVIAAVLDSWRYLQREREFKLFGYVILDDHMHMIASAPRLPQVIQSFKSYTARQIIDLLKRDSGGVLLQQLHVHKLRHKTQSTYQVWQEGSQPKQIQNEEMMRQKLEYIHDNPVKRGHVENPVDWRYSSARYYATRSGLIEVMCDWT